MERHFDEELRELKQRLLRMADLAQEMVGLAVKCLSERNPAWAQEVFKQEEEVNHIEIEIEDAVLRLLAIRQPAAGDLRLLTAMLKINNDLERVGDQAVNISETALYLLKEPPIKKLVLIPEMAALAQKMIKSSIEAFVNHDAALAKQVCIDDDQVDDLNGQIFAKLIESMAQDPTIIGRAVDLILVARNIERVADHATNIGEDVIFIVEGKNIKTSQPGRSHGPAQPMTKDSAKTACVLVSGGVDSSVLMAQALERYDSVTPLYFRNYLRWEDAEFFSLKNFHRMMKSPKLQPLRVIEAPMRDIYERHWSITGIKVPGQNSKDESMYLPGRNIIFLSKAACFAAIGGIGAIEIGVLKNNPFKDSTKVFLKKMEDVLSIGLDRPFEIHAPFSKMKKEEVILLGKKLPLELTFSCVNPKGYEHCGECNKCMERKKGFFQAGIFDKTKYKKQGI